MKKSIFVVVALMVAMVLSFSSCKSDADKGKDAAASLKTACKDKNADDAKKYYKEAMTAYADAMLSALNDAKTEEDLKKAEEEIGKIEKEVNEALKDCDCFKAEDRDAIEKELEKEYSEKIEKATEEAMKRMMEAAK